MTPLHLLLKYDIFHPSLSTYDLARQAHYPLLSNQSNRHQRGKEIYLSHELHLDLLWG